ncbi:hypothetical protein BaRGS_00007091 [Batillaria attramentaria]|uniref:Uncharacterized protein n=1 Tax=Batillaria attramentaria TaxID=370345 RepID=A0ABD0LQY6_9CAEN
MACDKGHSTYHEITEGGRYLMKRYQTYQLETSLSRSHRAGIVFRQRTTLQSARTHRQLEVKAARSQQLVCLATQREPSQCDVGPMASSKRWDSFRRRTFLGETQDLPLSLTSTDVSMSVNPVFPLPTTFSPTKPRFNMKTYTAQFK